MKNIKLNELFIKQRNILGLTQEDVAEKLGFSVQTISRWEKGEYLNDIDTIKMLCDFYNIEVKDSLFMPKKREHYILKIIVLLFFACFFYLININNYVKVYRLMSLNDDFDVKGVVYNQKDNNLFVLNSINYQGKGEKYLYDYSYIIEYDNHIIYESKKMHAKIPEKDEDVYKLSEVVENIQLYEPIEYVKNKNLYIKILYKNTDYYLENIMICIEIVKF